MASKKIILKNPIVDDPCDIERKFANHTTLNWFTDISCLKWLACHGPIQIDGITKIFSSLEGVADLDTLLAVTDLLDVEQQDPGDIFKIMIERYDKNFVFTAEYFIRQKTPNYKWAIEDYLTLIEAYGSYGLAKSGLRVISLMTARFERAILCAYNFDIGQFFHYIRMAKSDNHDEIILNAPEICTVDGDQEKLDIIVFKGQELQYLKEEIEGFIESYLKM